MIGVDKLLSKIFKSTLPQRYSKKSNTFWFCFSIYAKSSLFFFINYSSSISFIDFGFCRGELAYLGLGKLGSGVGGGKTSSVKGNLSLNSSTSTLVGSVDTW
jgi:hypothetical protein